MALADDSSSYLIPSPRRTKDTYWPLGKVAFSLLPLAGTSTRRKTLQEEVVKGIIWTHDQIQGIVNVNVPVRQTVVKIKDGLLVYNPVAPTPELLNMMRQLETDHGPVRHVVLGTVALEHKATFPAFCQQFPKATAWVQPGQWSFPVSLPLNFFGLDRRRTKVLPTKDDGIDRPPWTEEFDYEMLGPFRFESVGAFGETALFHKATKTLLVTDTVCSITRDAPPIVQEDPRALLYHARDYADQEITDSTEMRRKGWRRMVQFGLVFFPSQIEVSSVSEAFVDARHVPVNLRNLGDGGVPFNLYPWKWPVAEADQASFDAISKKGRLFCPPILTKLILDREPKATLEWVDRICLRFDNMQRIIPCHLDNHVEVQRSSEFYEAFEMLRSTPGRPIAQRALPEDLALLQTASDRLTNLGIVAPSEVCDGEPARRVGRFAR